MRKYITIILSCFFATTMAEETFSVSIKNTAALAKADVPVVLKLKEYATETSKVKSAMVTINGAEVPCQLDDIDRDGIYDELCFLTDLKKHEKKLFTVTLYDDGKPREYAPRTYSELLLRNPKVKIKNKHNIYLKEMTVDRGVDPYQSVHHHGIAFESELVAFRIYFDHRQTVDAYGKFHKQLEIKDTQFYTDADQKAAGYGDDVLWVGSSYGVGALRGWDGTNQLMLEDVDSRTQRVIAQGPVRSIIELVDENWRPTPSAKPVTMTTRYTIYGGHRDVDVDIFFNHTAKDYEFATGIINVKDSKEFSDNEGLRGCWGSDWPVGVKDTAGHKIETVGLGIIIPKKYIRKEMPADKVNYTYVVGTDNDELHYKYIFASDNEDFGVHSAEDWFKLLKAWKKEIETEVIIEKL